MGDPSGRPFQKTILMTKTIAVLGAFDTKSDDFAFLKAEIEKQGCKALLVDFSVVGEPGLRADIPREEVARIGGIDLAGLAARRDRGEAMTAMAEAIRATTRKLFEDKRIDGVISMGGGGGTSVATAAMRALPVGFPKLMVSTLAAGDVSSFVGESDIVMMPSVIDVNGVNRISRMVYAHAAGAICGMVGVEISAADDKPLIAVTMFGNTTRAVNHAKPILEAAGYEVLVFHATGAGGRTMEALINDGLIVGVLDLTTTEWADELLGGVLSAGPARLEAAGRKGIPQVIAPGCLDMCNFWARPTVPEQYRDRLFYEWNANVTLMRTTVEENARLGEIFAHKLNAARGKTVVYIPLRGWSEIDVAGQPFHNPQAILAFSQSLKMHLIPNIPVIEMDVEINDPLFAQTTAQALLDMMKR